MRKTLLSLIALLALPGASVAAADDDNLVWARLGQRAAVAGPVRVTPIRVLEDSRCPMEARCVWAGQVRLLVRITVGRGHAVRQITSNTPVAAGQGMLELASVMPPQSTQHPPRQRDYRFGFRFTRKR